MIRSMRSLAMLSTLLLACGVLFSTGCASTGETGQRDQLTANVGNYPPPPPGAGALRVGVPPFAVSGQQGNFSFSDNDMEDMAADQLTTLMHLTNRFDVIERAQLQKLLAEQGLEGIVRPGELAQPGQVRGVDYLLIGKITNFRVKAERVSHEAGVQHGLISRKLLKGFTGGFDKNQTKLTTEVGVDLRLVDPTTGMVKVAHFSQFKQSDTAESFGVDIAGVGGSGDADVQISEDDAGKIMRLAFDDALKKMIPQIDSRVLTASAQGSANTTAAATRREQHQQHRREHRQSAGDAEVLPVLR